MICQVLEMAEMVCREIFGGDVHKFDGAERLLAASDARVESQSGASSGCNGIRRKECESANSDK